MGGAAVSYWTTCDDGLGADLLDNARSHPHRQPPQHRRHTSRSYQPKRFLPNRRKEVSIHDAIPSCGSKSRAPWIYRYVAPISRRCEPGLRIAQFRSPASTRPVRRHGVKRGQVRNRTSLAFNFRRLSASIVLQQENLAAYLTVKVGVHRQVNPRFQLLRGAGDE